MDQQVIQAVTIVGAGTQGTMLAFRSLAFGHKVFLQNRSQPSLDRSMTKIQEVALQWMKSGKLGQDRMNAICDNLKCGTNLTIAVAEADIVIENVREDLELKQNLAAN